MKHTPFLVLTALAVTSLFAQNSAAPATKASPFAVTLAVSEAVVSAPFVLKDGAISQPTQTELAGGGKAIFTFKLAEAGDYVIHAIANAPDEESNSFFLNIDGELEDPLMVWDMEVTQGFVERVVSWRGSGDSANNEFAPKIFRLAAGEHKLIVVGREPAQLKSLSLRRSG